MIPDTVKAFAGLFLIVTLGIALGFSRWELSSLNKEFTDLNVKINVQDTIAKEQQVKFKPDPLRGGAHDAAETFGGGCG